MGDSVERRLILGERIIFAVLSQGHAVHFHVRPDWKDHSRSWGGVEFHAPVEHSEDGDCWLLGGPCEHDGSSLYASEVVIPMFHRCCEMRVPSYDMIWNQLESLMAERIEQSTQESS